MPRGLIEASRPVKEEDEVLEYDVYGWYRFDTDEEGVRRLGRQWLCVEQLAGARDWEDARDQFQARVAKLTEPYV